MLRLRGWIVVLIAALVAGAGVGLSRMQEVRYEAESKVLISRTNLSSVLTDTQDSRSQESDFRRVVDTQAVLARVPRVARRTLDRAGHPDRSEAEFLEQSSAEADPDSDLLTLRVDDEQRAVATRLAGDYAREFVRYREEQTVNRLLAVKAALDLELKDLPSDSDQATVVRRQLRRIRNLVALGDSSVNVVQTPTTAQKTQPKPVRNGILGALLGLLLGLGLALLLHRRDTRLRRSADIEQRLGLALLGRLPAPPRELARDDRVATLLDPTGEDAESFRVLRTNLAFADLEREARSIIVTSAVQSEGKSTTAANLAVAIARGGRRVILCDCDFRRPYLERFFDLDREPGATDVVLGRATLDDALVEVDVGAASAGGVPGFHGPSSNGNQGGGGRLELLPTGTLPPNVGEFVTSTALGDLLSVLGSRCDVLLIDAPPLLQVGDALALTQRVDALVLVARLRHVRCQMIDEVKRLLDRAPITVLGVVVTDARAEPGYGYGYYPYEEHEREETGLSALRHDDAPPPAESKPGKSDR